MAIKFKFSFSLSFSQILHYRIKVIENTQSKRSSVINTISETRNRFFEIDFSQTNIEGSNSKKIPSEKIITRRSISSSSTSSSTKESLPGTPKISLSLSSTEGANTRPQSLPSPMESIKNSLKKSPISGLKRIFSNSSTNILKPIKFGSRKNSVQSSPSEPSSPVKTESSKPTTAWEHTDSIDKTIIENNDLKKIFVRSYNIDVKNIDDLLNENAMAMSQVNRIPKPPRLSMDMEKENTNEIAELQTLLRENGAVEKLPQPNSPITN